MKKQNTKKKFVSLKWRTLVEIFFAGTVSFALALCAVFFTNYYVSHYYLSEEASSNRIQHYVFDLQAYVTENDILSGDAISLAKWSKRNSNIHLFIFEGEEVKHEFSGGVEITDENDPNKEGSLLVPDKGDTITEEELAAASMYTIEFGDRSAYVSVIDFTERGAYLFGYSISAAVAIFLFLALVLIFQSRQTKAIMSLSRDVRVVSEDNLHGTIRMPRNDELGLLASDVNEMRDAILRKTEEKQRAWQANSDLITSISHDIRTPLTTLLGYLDLLSTDSSCLSEEQRSYLRICGEKASQIKSMSDDLFLYFLAFNKSQQDIQTESYDAEVLFGQLIGDHLLELSVEGFTATTLQSGSHCTVTVDVEMLRRVFDNLFSNILKYADRTCPVEIRSDHTEGVFLFSIRNVCATNLPKRESTRIGIKTCENILHLMNGSFSCQTENNFFTAEIRLPVANSDLTIQNRPNFSVQKGFSHEMD